MFQRRSAHVPFIGPCRAKFKRQLALPSLNLNKHRGSFLRPSSTYHLLSLPTNLLFFSAEMRRAKKRPVLSTRKATQRSFAGLFPCNFCLNLSQCRKIPEEFENVQSEYLVCFPKLSRPALILVAVHGKNFVLVYSTGVFTNAWPFQSEGFIFLSKRNLLSCLVSEWSAQMKPVICLQQSPFAEIQ